MSSSNLNAYLHESLDGMKITQAFTREEENAKIYNKLNTKMYKSWMKAQYTSNLVWFSVNNISTWVVGAMYLVGFSLLGPAVQIGTLIAISAYAWRFWQPILQLSNLYNTFINAVAYLERIFEMIDEPVLVDDAPDATELPPIKGDVTFDDVTFSYDGSINVLEHFNLDVKAGGVHRTCRSHGCRQNDGRQPYLAFLQHQFRPGARRRARHLQGNAALAARANGHHAAGQLHFLRHHHG